MKYKKLFLQESSSLNDIESRKPYSLKEFLRQINSNSSKLKKIEALLHGTFQSKEVSTGLDFNEIREYKIGDDLRHISWKSLAKTGKLHTKEYFAEKEVRTFFLIDISNSMFCGKKLKTLISLSAFLLNLSCTFSEKIGGVFFSSDIKYHFPLSQSYTQADIMFHALINFLNNPSKKNILKVENENTNLSKAFEFTNQSFHKKGMVFIVSDLINLSSWGKMIFDIAKKHNVYFFQIYESLDFSLSSIGYVTLIDPETNKRFFVNTDSKVIKETYLDLMNEKQKKLEEFLRTIEVKHFVIEQGDFIANS